MAQQRPHFENALQLASLLQSLSAAVMVHVEPRPFDASFVRHA